MDCVKIALEWVETARPMHQPIGESIEFLYVQFVFCFFFWFYRGFFFWGNFVRSAHFTAKRSVRIVSRNVVITNNKNNHTNKTNTYDLYMMVDFRSNPATKCAAFPYAIGREIRTLRQNVLGSNLIGFNELCDAEFKHFVNWRRCHNGDAAVQYSVAAKPKQNHRDHYGLFTVLSISAMLCLVAGLMLTNFHVAVEYFTSIRCFVPNNYIVWEATRPISNCQFCAGIHRPLVLANISQTEFLVSVWDCAIDSLKNE